MARERTSRRRGCVRANERRPAGAASEARRPSTKVPVRPDLSASRTPASRYLGPTTYGLTRDELRTEWRRLAAEGWARWELDSRFAAVAA